MSSSSNEEFQKEITKASTGFKRIQRSLSCSSLQKIESVKFSFKPEYNIELTPEQFREMYCCEDVLFDGTFSTVFFDCKKNASIKMLDFLSCHRSKLPPRKIESIAICEINALKALNHPNVIKLLHYTFDKTLRSAYLAFQYFPRSDLFEYLTLSKYKSSSLPECFAKGLFFQLVSAVRHCHDNNICHGDIKPDNILVSEIDSIFSCKDNPVPQIVLIDFGLSQVFTRDNDGNEGYLGEIVGSPAYVAPEIIGTHSYHGTKVDIWSMGVFLYTILFCEYPYKLNRRSKDPWGELFACMRTRPVVFPSSISVSSAAKDLILRMLQFEPNNRISIREIQCHRWFDCIK